MKIALAQINPTLGDFKKNRKKIEYFAAKAKESDADLIVFPELSLFGYLSLDLLERSSIVEAQLKELNHLKKSVPQKSHILVGAVSKNLKKGKAFQNSAILISKGKKEKIFSKQLLPSYDVFDETRHFEAGRVEDNIVSINGRKVLVVICEDIWAWGQNWKSANYFENPLLKLKNKKIDLVINLSASPYSPNHYAERRDVVSKVAKLFKCPVVYVNVAGAQDELIFDGGSFIIDKSGKLLHQSDFFKESVTVVDLKNSKPIKEIKIDKVEQLSKALELGVRDFVQKTGHTKVHLGLSGGIDSAVVACLAAKAIGSQNLTCIALPGPFNEARSLILAETLSKNLGCRFEKISIDGIYKTLCETIESSLGEMTFGVLHENLQARVRGLLLMAFSNKEKSLLLSTSNKSEFASGYCTLYGDMCGGLSVIGDLLKEQVYELARYYNIDSEIIPGDIITRAPSAELRPNQKDQDTLPPYAELDKSVEKLILGCKEPKSESEKWLLPRLMQSEFKRWQAPPILRVSSHAFGRGRRYPIAHKALF